MQGGRRAGERGSDKNVERMRQRQRGLSVVCDAKNNGSCACQSRVFVGNARLPVRRVGDIVKMLSRLRQTRSFSDEMRVLAGGSWAGGEG